MRVDPAQARSVFLKALGKSEGQERTAFLDDACRENSELRREVDVLLEAHRQSGAFLDQGALAAGPTLDIEPKERPGATIGAYKLLQQIGEGGMGVVYMAEQTHPVRRRVALKIIKPGMDSRQVIARFEAERQALAMMDHPNIAKVLDAGTTDESSRHTPCAVAMDGTRSVPAALGRPYFVMELVKGVPITEYCDEHQLTPRQRLELFVQVCHAVQHAHQRGVIHRDIKPTNVLVAEYDDRPVPKVIDFGVAKAIEQQLTEKSMFTQFGQVVGTIDYMSPEQAKLNQLDIDTRSDIYSLGVLLYELLTGETPFDRKRLRCAAFDEMLRIIREEEPPRPSTRLSSSHSLPAIAANRHTEPKKLSTLVRGELDWIVMKCLEKDRNRRYKTANGVAHDVERHLKGDAVTACPPSAAYRFRKFARRNKAVFVTGALVAAALVLGTVLSVWQAVRATRAEWLAEGRYESEQRARHEAETARDNENQARREAETQKEQAEASFALARSAVDQFLNKVADDELLRVPGMQQLRQDLLSSALGFYERFGEEQRGGLGLRKDLASAQYRLGRIHSEMGNRQAAVAANARAIQEYEALRAQGQVGPDVSLGLARAYFAALRYDETERLCREALKADPKSAEARRLLAQTFNDRAAKATNEAAQETEALRYHQQALHLREELAREFPENAAYQAELGSTLNNLGVLLAKQGNNAEALAMYQRGTEFKRRACDMTPHSILWREWLATGLGNVAGIQWNLGETEAALKSLQEMVAVRRKLVSDNPHVPSLRGELSRAYRRLATHSSAANQNTEAARLLRLAREVLENMPRETAAEMVQLAEVYAALAQPAEQPAADEAFRAELRRNADLAVEMLCKAVDAGHRDAAALEANPALAALRQREDFKQLLAGVEKLAQAGKLMAQTQDTDAAKLAARQESLRLVKQAMTDQPQISSHRRTYAEALRSMGEVQTGLKQFAEAEKSLAESIAVWRELDQGDAGQAFSPRLGRIATQISVAELYLANNRGADGRRLYDECFRELKSLWKQHGGDQQRAFQIADQERRACRAYGRLALWPLLANHAQEQARQRRVAMPIWNAQLAMLLPLVDGDDALRSYCQVLLADWKGAGGRQWAPFEIAHLTRACCLVDSPSTPADQLADWSRKYENPNKHWVALISALAHYRAGRYAETLRILDQPPVCGDFTSLDADCNNLKSAYVYALALKRLGRDDRSRQQLSIADLLWERVCRESLLAKEPGLIAPLDRYWPNFVAAQVLRREAWREAAGQTADESLIYLLQARAYHSLGNAEHAEKALAAAAAREGTGEPGRQPGASPGDNIPFWALHGRILAEMGRQTEAEASFAKAIAFPGGKRPALAAAPFSPEEAADHQAAWAKHLDVPVEFENSLGMTFRLVPPGRFQMGTPVKVREELVKQLRDEKWTESLVVHHEKEGCAPVFLTRPYYMGVCEVTVGQFRRFVEETGYRTDAERQKTGGFAHRNGWVRHPAHIWRTPSENWVLKDDQPVVHMSRNDAEAFCRWLSKKEGRQYTLPSEAQWEFACRAGSQSLYGIGDDPSLLEQIAWTPETLATAGKSQAQPVGTKQPNPFGLYDMLGNVWEHCRDGYIPGPCGDMPLVDPETPLAPPSGSVGRGGAWYRRGPVSRCGHRVEVPVDSPNDAGFGFRVAITSHLEQVRAARLSRPGTDQKDAPQVKAAASVGGR